MSDAAVSGLGDVRRLLIALTQLWADAMPILKYENWGQIPAILQKIKEDLAAIYDLFGGEDAAMALLAKATRADYDLVAAEVRVTCAGPANVVGFEFNGKLIEWLIKYGPTIYNIFAAFFGWPPLPPIPLPIDGEDQNTTVVVP
jgi:hypothetical protein